MTPIIGTFFFSKVFLGFNPAKKNHSKSKKKSITSPFTNLCTAMAQLLDLEKNCRVIGLLYPSTIPSHGRFVALGESHRKILIILVRFT